MRIETININEDILFNLYDAGIELGYSTKSKGKTYPHKIRINKIINNSDIKVYELNNKKFIDLIGIRKFISFSHSEKKTEFIEWLKKKKYIDSNEVFISTRKEPEFFKALSLALTPFGYIIDRQYIENNYRFDGYIKSLDTVIEYDENKHSHYNKENEKTREIYIINNHKKLIRVNDSNDIYYNIGYTIKELFSA